jgi:hypothetical protein
MVETIEEEVTIIEGLKFSIHFDVDPQELNQLFQVGFFNWIRQGIIQSRPERPPFQPQNVPDIPLPPHVSMQP